MKRQATTVIAGFATFIVFLTGCSGLSSYRDDMAIQAMAKRSYARREGKRAVGPCSKDYERGWRQAYFDISHGGDGCPPSVPPEVYWSTKYQNPQGCKHITAWYDGYRCGSAAAMAECRSSFAKVPVVANCIRPSAVECSPVESCREPMVPEWEQFGAFNASQVSEEQQGPFAEPVSKEFSPVVDAATQGPVREDGLQQSAQSAGSMYPTVAAPVVQQPSVEVETVEPTSSPFPPLASLEAGRQSLPNKSAVDASHAVSSASFSDQEILRGQQILPVSYPETTVRLPLAE